MLFFLNMTKHLPVTSPQETPSFLTITVAGFIHNSKDADRQGPQTGWNHTVIKAVSAESTE